MGQSALLSRAVTHGHFEISPQSKVRDMNFSKAICLDEGMSALEASKIMVESGSSSVIVMSPINQPIGIATEKDFITKIISSPEKSAQTTRLKEVMTDDFVCVQLDDELYDIPFIMLDGGFRHVPVVEHCNVIGVITVHDILSYLAA